MFACLDETFPHEVERMFEVAAPPCLDAGNISAMR
jgi:hypothetical protein